jgi:predicted dinucleotide-binding enzyme
MNVAIIGTGNVGSALGGSFVRAGHEVTFAARDGGRTQALARRVGARAATSPAEAAAAADAVVIAVPYGAVRDVARGIAAAVVGKVVIDATNPLRPDYSGLATVEASGAEELAAALPGARVAKAFNTVFAGVDAEPTTLGTTVDALFATDDETARATVAELASSVGFRPVHVGPLAAARELEAMAWLNIRLQMLANGGWTTSFVLVGVPEAAIAA